MQVYGDRIISRLADGVAATRAIANGADDDEDDEAAAEAADAAIEVGFGAVVAGEEQFQVCRMFAAMLQLINNG